MTENFDVFSIFFTGFILWCMLMLAFFTILWFVAKLIVPIVRAILNGIRGIID